MGEIIFLVFYYARKLFLNVSGLGLSGAKSSTCLKSCENYIFDLQKVGVWCRVLKGKRLEIK